MCLDRTSSIYKLTLRSEKKQDRDEQMVHRTEESIRLSGLCCRHQRTRRNNNQGHTIGVSSRGGARGRLGGYSPPSEHASPRRKLNSDVFGDFWHL